MEGSKHNRKDHWTVNVGTRVSPETKRRLEALAKKADVSVSAYAAQILEQHVEEKGKPKKGE